MTLSTRDERRRLETLDAAALANWQLERLNALLSDILPDNAFYAAKLSAVSRPLRSLDELAQIPFTFKEELVGPGGAHDFATNRTWPIERYSRLHQTSGTHGRPIVVLDTAEDWQWWINTWQYVLDAAEIDAADRVLMAFSFGPFIGFWSAHDALAARGCLLIPTGGMSSLARLEMARRYGATVIFCTPSYALHLAEVAAQHEIDVAALGVRRIILSGEPGGSVPAVRGQIEAAWQATCLDHCGASEIGPWGYGDLEGRGVWINEAEFIAEFLSIATGGPAIEGELAELVLTTLGRRGSPIIRYRTGDLVRPSWQGPEKVSGTVSSAQIGGSVAPETETVPDTFSSIFSSSRFVWLEGGILGRADDMLVVRGVNIFPSSIEQIVRSFPEIVEFQMTVYTESHLDRMLIEIEDRLEQPDRVAAELKLRLGLSVDVQLAPLGALPRYEGKGRRFIDRRGGTTLSG